MIVAALALLYVVVLPLGILWTQPGWEGAVAAAIIWVVTVPLLLLVVLVAWGNRKSG